MQNGWKTPEKKFTQVKYRFNKTKIQFMQYCISPSPPNQCWLAIIHNHMDGKHRKIGFFWGGEGWLLYDILSLYFPYWSCSLNKFCTLL